MNWSQMEGQWKQVKAQLKSKWAKLTDDDLGNLAAKRDDLVGKLQERYGILKEEAERQVDAFVTTLGPDRTQPQRKT
ncbi:MAG: CsbD family protein [Myxococcaceae bacterium]